MSSTDTDSRADRSEKITARYLDLLKLCLTDMIYIDDPMSAMAPFRPMRRAERIGYCLLSPIMPLLRRFNIQLVRPNRQYFFDYAAMAPDEVRDIRSRGMDWPTRAHTMVGLKRLDNLQYCVETVLREQIPGDVLETGVWRGGASIFMKGVLTARGDASRSVWVADSFRGLPAANPERYPADRGMVFHLSRELAISREQVESNFRAYGLLDERVRFLEGWFKDTLPSAPIERLAILRLDGDLYESTIQTLDAMYGKLSAGGFLIVDDFGLAPCKAAVDDFRKRHDIRDPVIDIDGMAVYWRKAAVTPDPATIAAVTRSIGAG